MINLKMKNLQIKSLKSLHLLVMALSLGLAACGGGSSGGTPAVNNSSGDSSQGNGGQSAPQSFTAVTLNLMNADENSEPMDVSTANINSDADDDETAFVSLMESMTITP